MLLISIMTVGIEAVSAQVNTPYSMYGYGLIGDRATSMQRQMGSVGYAMNSGRQINVMNPASYASIDSLTFLFDMGADLSFIWSKEGDTKNKNIGGGLDYVTMQFPLCKFMGASIGLLPYSSVGYAFGNEISHGAMENQGTGGINEAYFGLSGKYAGFSLGANIAYAFGNIQNDVYSRPATSGETLFEHVMEIRDWSLLIGAQYTKKLSRYDRMTLGLTYSPKKSLHGNTWVTQQETQSTTVPDTVGQMKLGGNFYTPNCFGAGVSFVHERISRLMVEFDFTFQEWSKAKYAPIVDLDDPSKIVFAGMNFNNRTRFALGAEYVPDMRGSYGKRIAYRLGGYYSSDYLSIRSNSVREYGVTAGVGLHTPGDKTLINIGLEWKHRDSHPVSLVSENYLNITVGINFNEVWFWQRKIR
ncbi:MAG: hypothetical protein HDS80_05875 [Bacteroidales bacterium]|nr:hypothetical protein [Bacteroidales bacterium]